MRSNVLLCCTFAMTLGSIVGSADARADDVGVVLLVGEARRIADHVMTSSDPKTAEAFSNGFLAGLRAGTTRVSGGGESITVTVKQDDRPLIDPATLRHYDDSRKFTIDGRTCYGSELNGQRATAPQERQFTRANRVINPNPLREDRPLDWEVQDGTEVYDGAGILLGTVAAELKVGDAKVGERKVPVSKFNFGMSKVLGGRLCVYAFAVSINPAPDVRAKIDPAELTGGTVGTSAWLPLDRVVEKEALLERIGLGKPKLPRLPLEEKPYRITGGDPKQYVIDAGELSIVKDVASGPVPSHYLRRPSGTINLLYSVPGFGLGGQSLDSFLISPTLRFRAAQGAKVFVQPTYFPSRHAQAGQVSPKTMTFLYGAVEVKGADPIYGWIAQEALER